ncbi:MAG TPA: cytochrome c biogenesis CcdA family protein [Acidimicrobiales bacterium]|nr:cytochrome c biogenesis CcdA family protein [Acidimicrobiales bacterium]
MIDVPLAYAFSAGLVATVNPCGFPMLPAYLSYFIGSDDADADPRGRVPRALGAAGAVSLGFLAVFSVLGIPINAGLSSIYRAMPWLTLLVGTAMVALGVAMLSGRRLKVALPRLDRGGTSRRFGSMVLFGASYAIASLSCTLPIFLSVVANTAERANAASGALAFVAYAAGMSVVLTVLTLALALARESMVRRLRRALRYADRVAGVLLVAVGVYLLYYGVHAMDPANSAAISPVGVVEDWSAAATGWLSQGGAGLGAVLAVLAMVMAAAALLTAKRHRRRPPAPSGHGSPAPDSHDDARGDTVQPGDDGEATPTHAPTAGRT